MLELLDQQVHRVNQVLKEQRDKLDHLDLQDYRGNRDLQEHPVQMELTVHQDLGEMLGSLETRDHKALRDLRDQEGRLGLRDLQVLKDLRDQEVILDHLVQ